MGRLGVSLARDLEGTGARVLTDPALTAPYGREWTGRFPGTAEMVAVPADTAQVAAVLAVCSAHATAVVPQGGRTGLVGGTVPAAGQVVLDLTRLTALTVGDGMATAGAGVTVGALQRAAAGSGQRYGVDLASRDSATVGGTVATNAGGVRVLRHGPTRAQLLGVEAVLADGTVLRHLPGFVRDNTGYHLPSLLCGSEGTLAVLTAAQLRLLPSAPVRDVALLAFAGPEPAAAAAGALARWPTVEAVELFARPGLELVCAVASLPRPFPAPHAAYVLVEARAQDGMETGLDRAVERIDAADAAVALDAADAERLWSYRERHTEAIATRGPVHKLDVTLPPPALGAFLAGLPTAVVAAYPVAEVWLFGHAGDGNVHVNVTGVDPDDDGVDDLVLRRVVAAGGSISSEHGIGRAKARWLPLARSAGELALMRRVKTAFDPAGLLNPGVLGG